MYWRPTRRGRVDEGRRVGTSKKATHADNRTNGTGSTGKNANGLVTATQLTAGRVRTAESHQRNKKEWSYRRGVCQRQIALHH